MKTLYIIRHAKSSWKDSALSDYDRPLNQRGERDAPFMGELIRKQGGVPDLIISSPANRAFTTASYFADKLSYKKADIDLEKNIYEAGIGSLMKIINRINDKNTSVMIFGHNPGLTMLSNYLSGSYIDNLPTCGVVKLDLNINTWKDAGDLCGTLINFEYPKKYFPK